MSGSFLPFAILIAGSALAVLAYVVAGRAAVTHFGVGLPTAIEHTGILGVIDQNIVNLAKDKVIIFTGSLSHGMYDNEDIATQVRAALERKVSIDLMFGSTVDEKSGRVLDELFQHPEIVRLFMIRPSDEWRILKGQRWTVKHFAVSDERHVCVEDFHDLGKAPIAKKAWVELHNVPAMADRWVNVFESLRSKSAIQLEARSRADFHAAVLQAGGKIVTFPNEKAASSNARRPSSQPFVTT